MSNFFAKNSVNFKYNWGNITQNYTFYNGVPKKTLFINLSPNCTAQRRQFIINGLRPYFKSDLTLVVDKVQILDSLKVMTEAFTFFVGLIGLISLILTFFLLMVATSSNIRDNIWEYGVLRSMGVTKNEGTRVFMYEAFIVVVTAGIIGVVIGISVSCLITA
jgi:ABC-type antimicrobial peptide transport system permease subunit